ncbi:MAG: hypothetical protein IJK24_08305 [Oscillospiraceae bacterium]|nr:hypothetical protein [Oscillospiraceae bacterium]
MKKIKQCLNRLPLLLQYILIPFGFCLIGGFLLVAFLYAVLSLAGIYNGIENTLNLKASSPWIIIPLFVCLFGAVLSFLLGFLMYFHKYKRSSAKTKFSQNYGIVLAQEKKQLGIK